MTRLIVGFIATVISISTAILVTAQETKPEAEKTEAKAEAKPKGRRLTEDENVKLQLMQSQFENFARSICESAGIKFDNCAVGNGVVMERPAAPANTEAAKPAAKPKLAKPAEPETKK